MTARLDDASALIAGDPQGLVDAYRALPETLEAGYRMASGSLVRPRDALRSVTFCAMGGSAAAGDVASSAFADRLRVPVETVRGHELPLHCGRGALVVCSSYSGNTEETLAAYREALSRGCETVAIASGGELASAADESGAPLVRLPGDAPQPRAALGSLAGAAIGTLSSSGLLEDADADVMDARDSLARAAGELGQESPPGPNEAKSIDEWLGDRIPLVWGWRGIGAAAAWRWKCAFNENAKLPAFASELPELDHHEVVGWASRGGDGFGVVVLRHEGEPSSAEIRIAATLDVAGLEAHEVWASGDRPLARALSLMLIGDLASAYHALARGIDPAPIEAIARVKGRLGP